MKRANIVRRLSSKVRQIRLMTQAMALSGINVLDLSESIGGAYCTKLLADLGAEVLLVERPGSGHPLRHAGPYQDAPHIEKSGLFLYYARK